MMERIVSVHLLEAQKVLQSRRLVSNVASAISELGMGVGGGGVSMMCHNTMCTIKNFTSRGP